MREERRIATEAPHREPREEQVGGEAPSPAIPTLGKEACAFGLGSRNEYAVDRLAAVDERQHETTEDREIALEAPDSSEPHPSDRIEALTPKRAAPGVE